MHVLKKALNKPKHKQPQFFDAKLYVPTLSLSLGTIKIILVKRDASVKISAVKAQLWAVEIWVGACLSGVCCKNVRHREIGVKSPLKGSDGQSDSYPSVSRTNSKQGVTAGFDFSSILSFRFVKCRKIEGISNKHVIWGKNLTKIFPNIAMEICKTTF